MVYNGINYSELRLSIFELLFEGWEGCGIGVPKHLYHEMYGDDPYIVIQSDTSANCGRGRNSIWFRGNEIAAEYMIDKRSIDRFDYHGPSNWLYHEAEKHLLEMLPQLV